MQEDCCNPRVDMETGEVYSQAPAPHQMDGHASHFQGSREINEMTMYQHLDMDQPPRESHETGRED